MDEGRTHHRGPLDELRAPCPRPRSLGHIVRRGIPLAVLLIVVAGAYLYWSRTDSAPGHEPAAGPQGPVNVSVQVVRH